MTTAFWSPNQASIAQVETYTFTAPSSAGNTYTATINGKSVTYTANSTDGLTAAAAATGLYNLLNASTSITPELLEIQFSNTTSGVVTATARTPGVPFANVTVNGVSGQGLVLSTGNGLANGITTTHTTANASPSDVFDPLNWLRVTGSASGIRGIPVNGDDVIVGNSNVPLLWNLDRLVAVLFNTYTRWQSFTATIGLPENNPNGYAEWRATYFKFGGPTGSTPAGGLTMVLGYESTPAAQGSGPTRERYDLGSSRFTAQILNAGSAEDEYGVRLLGVHTDNVVNVVGPVSVAVAMLAGENSKLNSVTLNSGGTLGVGSGVTFSTNIFGTTSSVTMYGGTALLNSAPALLTLNNGAQVNISTDALTWASITANGGSFINALAGGTITSLTLTNGSSLDKSQDGRALTITNSTLDGDSCFINDPLNSVSFTNATTVKQQVASGPIRFTGTRTIKLT